MRQTSAVPIRNRNRAPAPQSGAQGGFTIIETLIALAMVLLVTHVILRAVPGVYKASAQSEQLQLERSMWVSLGAEEWLDSPDEERTVAVERETDREGWLHLKPHLQRGTVPFWRGPIESIQPNPEGTPAHAF